MVRYLAARGHEILQIRASADLKTPEKRPVLEDIDFVMISIFPIPEGFWLMTTRPTEPIQ